MKPQDIIKHYSTEQDTKRQNNAHTTANRHCDDWQANDRTQQ